MYVLCVYTHLCTPMQSTLYMCSSLWLCHRVYLYTHIYTQRGQRCGEMTFSCALVWDGRGALSFGR